MVAPSADITALKQPESEVREVTERKVVLRIEREKDFVGLNIRGGKEFGLGIYISRYESIKYFFVGYSCRITGFHDETCHKSLQNYLF